MRAITAEPLVRQVKKLRIQREDFDILKVIGRGTFSKVAVASMCSTQQVYALKIMKIKWDMLKRGEETLCHVMDRVPAGVHLAFVGFSYTATRRLQETKRRNREMERLRAEIKTLRDIRGTGECPLLPFVAH
ncbi:hypothetical protein SKAU_G00089560 [Synaphobranchus kaupii]|uniref:Protein kinase domain-containing protein n=1 Tax=Synaphobranchus kaupii TaxID=118154 RepID=A0A9Q1J6C4_SYNKA|nr:hypothetical protein SKAU_G00089560 [Synaphobranchus kaupii]